jgi:hypothetical protein
MHVALEGIVVPQTPRHAPTPGLPYLATWNKYKQARIGMDVKTLVESEAI